MHPSFYENRAGALLVKPTEYFFLVFLLLLSLYRVVFVKSNTFYLELYNENIVNTQTGNRLAQKKLKKRLQKSPDAFNTSGLQKALASSQARQTGRPAGAALATRASTHTHAINKEEKLYLLHKANSLQHKKNTVFGFTARFQRGKAAGQFPQTSAWSGSNGWFRDSRPPERTRYGGGRADSRTARRSRPVRPVACRGKA